MLYSFHHKGDMMLLETIVLILGLSRGLETMILLVICILECIHVTKIILHVCLCEYVSHILRHHWIDGSGVTIVWLKESKIVLGKRLVLLRLVLQRLVLRRLVLRRLVLRRLVLAHCTHRFVSFK